LKLNSAVPPIGVAFSQQCFFCLPSSSTFSSPCNLLPRSPGLLRRPRARRATAVRFLHHAASLPDRLEPARGWPNWTDQRLPTCDLATCLEKRVDLNVRSGRIKRRWPKTTNYGERTMVLG